MNFKARDQEWRRWRSSWSVASLVELNSKFRESSPPPPISLVLLPRVEQCLINSTVAGLSFSSHSAHAFTTD